MVRRKLSAMKYLRATQETVHRGFYDATIPPGKLPLQPCPPSPTIKCLPNGCRRRYTRFLRAGQADPVEIDLPFVVTPDSLMTMAFHESLDNAARLAMRKMIELLESHYGLSFHDAYLLCSVTADTRVTQFVNGRRGIHVLFPRTALANCEYQPNFLI
jgi:hypothetical protein